MSFPHEQKKGSKNSKHEVPDDSSPLFPDSETPGKADEKDETAAPDVDEFAEQGKALGNVDDLDFSAQWAQIESVQNRETVAEELTGQYLKLSDFKQGERRGFIVKGFAEFPNERTGDMVPAVKLQGKDKVNYICGANVVVSSVRNSNREIPFPIVIESNGKKKGKNGDYYDAKVFAV